MYIVIQLNVCFQTFCSSFVNIKNQRTMFDVWTQQMIQIAAPLSPCSYVVNIPTIVSPTLTSAHLRLTKRRL